MNLLGWIVFTASAVITVAYLCFVIGEIRQDGGKEWFTDDD